MADESVARTVVVTNPQGLHMRPAELFVKLARHYQAKVEVIKDGQRVDGASILALLMLAATEGSQLEIVATGPEAPVAVAALVELIERNFDEIGNDNTT